MDKRSFYIQIKRLADLFGIKNYNEDRVNLIWKEVNQFSDDWMCKTVDLFIGNCRQPPLMGEFREEISKERERIWKLRKREEISSPVAESISNYQCSDCSGTGIAWQPDNSVSKCYCDAGARRIENWPRLNRASLKIVK